MIPISKNEIMTVRLSSRRCPHTVSHIIIYIILSGVQYSPPENYTFGPGGEVLSYEAFRSLDRNLMASLWNGMWYDVPVHADTHILVRLHHR